MAILAICAGWVLPILGGWAVTGWLGWSRTPAPMALVGRVAVSTLAGIGMASLLSFGWLLAGGVLGTSYVAADSLCFLALAATGLSRPGRSGSGPAVLEKGRFDSIALGALLLGVVAAVAGMAVLSGASPHGESDAWMMWNMRAKFLVRAGTDWRIAFAPELGWTSTEYPLLLPLAIARLWAYGGESTLAPALLASTFTVCGPLALAAAVAEQGSTIRGATAGLLLVGTPGWLSLGASQYADVPLAALLVAGVGLLVGPAPVDGRVPRGKVVAAGFLLGLCGWSKNEGVAAAALTVVIFAAHRWRTGGLRIATRELLGVALGAAAPAATWVLFHVLVMPRVTGVLFTGNSWESLAGRLADGSRWATILSGLLSRIPGLGWGFPLMALAVAAAFALRERTPPRTPALAIAFALLATYVGVFMTTSWDLNWHVRLAADRLVLQAWPVILLGLFAPGSPFRRGRMLLDSPRGVQ